MVTNNMAPSSAATAYAAHERAITRLQTACTSLERQIPPPDNTDGVGEIATPPLRPRESNADIVSCQACAVELEELDANARAGHVCTHDRPPEQQAAPRPGSEDSVTRKKGKNKQPKAGVLKEYISNLDSCMEKFNDAVANNAQY